jgi:hypothetical protein
MATNIQLATTESVSSNYAGEAASRFYSAVLKSPSTIQNGGASFIDGIQYKWNIPKLDLSGLIANATCDFTPAGTVTRTERVLTVEQFEVNLALCKKNYKPTFDQMGGSAHAGLAPTFANHLVGLVAANVAQSRENVIWSGVNATAGEFDGFEVLFTAEAAQPAAYEIAGTTLSAANIISQLGLIRDAASSALYDSDGFAIRIPTSARKFYITAMAALGYMDKFHDGTAPLNFEGVPLIHCAGMSDNTMFATYADNLYYGVGSAGDAQSVRVLDQSDIDGSDNVHVIMKWADGIQVANPQDVITYGITNLSN